MPGKTSGRVPTILTRIAPVGTCRFVYQNSHAALCRLVYPPLSPSLGERQSSRNLMATSHLFRQQSYSYYNAFMESKLKCVLCPLRSWMSPNTHEDLSMTFVSSHLRLQASPSRSRFSTVLSVLSSARGRQIMKRWKRPLELRACRR